MVVLNAFSYFFIEYFDLFLLLISVGILTGIRNKAFYFVYLLLSFPLTLLSMTDALITGIAITAIFLLLRVKHWRSSGYQRELLGFLISLSLYVILPFFSSIIVSYLFKTPLDLLLENSNQVVAVTSLLDSLFFLASLLFIKKALTTKQAINKAAPIYILQLTVFLSFVYLFVEFLRKMQMLGNFRLVMMGFLIAQFSFTTFLTYMTLKKNKEKTEFSRLKEQIEMMNAYTAGVEKNYQEMKKFQHDYKNLLLGLNLDLANVGENQKYLKEMIEYSHQFMETSIMRFSGMSNLQINSVKSLIVTKLSQAERQGVKVLFECIVPVQEINLNEVKLVRTLGILLDNAIEAAIASDAKKINVLFIESKRQVEVVVENSYTGKLPSIESMNKLGFSSKGSNRGFGMSNLQAIVKETKQIEINHYANNDLFVTSLTIKKV